jgi:U3 small nucleolar RNA-associated protein 3
LKSSKRPARPSLNPAVSARVSDLSESVEADPLFRSLQKQVRGVAGGAVNPTLQSLEALRAGGRKRMVDGDDVIVDGSKPKVKKMAAVKSREEDSLDEDDDEDGFDRLLHAKDNPKNKSRRPAPESNFDDDDEEADIVENYSKLKKEYVQNKKAHYTLPARFGGATDDALAAGKKRAVTYEIMTNRGLVPHRKKENRNPRVKKRMAYDKAVIRRKGQVREVVAGSTASYPGEKTGIKANLSRSRKLGT